MEKTINLNGEMVLFSGNANPELAKRICACLKKSLGKAIVTTFSDGETQVQIEENVRGKDVFVVQPTCPPTNQNLMEFLIMIDAFKRASARRITAIPIYYGYGRQDRKVLGRQPISAKLVADLIHAAGAHRILSVELHAGQIQGFFNIPVDNIFASPVLIPFIKKSFKNPVIVSPDAGGVERARAYAKRLNADLAIIDKRRERPNDPTSIIMNVIGNVKDLFAVLIDDLVDTGGTLARAAEALIDKGAKAVTACCVHPVLSGSAIQNIEKSPLEKLIVLDTVPLSAQAAACSKIIKLSAAPLLAQAIKKIHNDESVSSLFN